MNKKSTFWSFKKYCGFFLILYLIIGILSGLVMSYKRNAAIGNSDGPTAIFIANNPIKFSINIDFEYLISITICIIFFFITLVIYKPIKKLIDK